MVETQLNIFDSVVLMVVFLSTLMAFFRGFVKEIFSLGAWIGAAIITLYSFPYVAEWLKPKFGSTTIATGFATLGTYVTCLVTLSLLNSVIIRYIRDGSDVGMLDNMLGLVFGFARGGFIVALGFLLVQFVWGKEQYPEWVESAATKPYVEKVSDVLAMAAPEYITSLQARASLLKPIKEGEALPDDASPAAGKETGYDPNQLRALDRLIQTHMPERKEEH